MVKCNPTHGKYLTMCIIYRGNIATQEIRQGRDWIRSSKTVQFVDWSPAGVKCGINYKPMHVANYSVIKKTSKSGYMVANSTAIGEILERFRKEVDMMYKHRAYVHWYVGEGMQEQEIEQAREDIAALEADYKELCQEMDEEDAIN